VATANGQTKQKQQKKKKQVHLAAHFPGVNSTTIWNRPDSGSQIEFSSFVHLAQAAERGKFDFFFLAEGLRLREHRGRLVDLDVVGRPDSLAVLAALAAVTDRIGLAATSNTTFNEPYELARQFASLDHLSNGRAAWNAVTSPDAFTGENFRRGGFLDPELRYERAAELIDAVQRVWDSWDDDAVAADQEAGTFVRPGSIGRFDHEGDQFRIHGRSTVPRSPQRYPVQIQAGDSDGGRELAARSAEVIFSRHSSFGAGQRFYADVKGRLARYGRAPDDLKIIPAAVAVLGDDEADAQERARQVHLDQVSPQGAIAFLETVWGRDLSDHDPDGPLPAFDPDVEGGESITRGRVRMFKDPVATAQQWRDLAESKHLTIRELVIEVSARETFVGSPKQVAAQIDDAVQQDAADGYILVPYLTPHGLDEFIDRVVPELQDRGAFRTEYEHDTLRGNLGLGAVR
jgi:FMN-dependent oxidoreductase (nitrilotriacetate monooxygenase family)